MLVYTGEGAEALDLSMASRIIVLQPGNDSGPPLPVATEPLANALPLDLDIDAVLSASRHGRNLAVDVSVLVANDTYEHALVRKSQGTLPSRSCKAVLLTCLTSRAGREPVDDLEILDSLPYLVPGPKAPRTWTSWTLLTTSVCVTPALPPAKNLRRREEEREEGEEGLSLARGGASRAWCLRIVESVRPAYS